MEHSVHLGAGHFVKTVSPTSAKALVTKMRRTLKHIKLDDDVDLDRLNDDLQEWDTGKDEDEDGTANMNTEGGEDDEIVDYDVGDALGKALALVTQVCCPGLGFELASSFA
jgi:hypothetical protein